MTSDAAAAISSAKAEMLTCRRAAEQVGIAAQVEHCRQAGRADRHAGRAAPPRAAEAVDDHQRRARRASRRSASAAASGSIGSSSARSTPSCGATFDWSMPALAMTKPSRCSTISTFGPRAHHAHRFRQDQLDQPRVLLDLGGQLDRAAATASTVAISTMRPSALETIFCASTSTSPSRSAELAGQRVRRSTPRGRRPPSPSEGRGQPATRAFCISRTSCASAAATCSENSFRKRSWSGPGAWKTRCLKPRST